MLVFPIIPQSKSICCPFDPIFSFAINHYKSIFLRWINYQFGELWTGPAKLFATNTLYDIKILFAHKKLYANINKQLQLPFSCLVAVKKVVIIVQHVFIFHCWNISRAGVAETNVLLLVRCSTSISFFIIVNNNDNKKIKAVAGVVRIWANRTTTTTTTGPLWPVLLGRNFFTARW